MTDREKLIEILVSLNLPYECDEALGWMADKLIANGVTFATDTNVGSKWISVEDEKPNGWIVTDPDTDYKEPETYIVFVKGATLPTTAYFLDGKFVPACDGFLSRKNCDCIGFADEVTHWMPMPEPPKED